MTIEIGRLRRRVCASSVEPTAWPKGVIQAVVASPSVADQPAAEVAPVRRALPWAPVMPSSPASTASVARWSSRTVTVGVNACSAGTVISRTMAASGSERQRSVGRVRRRVSTYVTGVAVPPEVIALVTTTGGRTTSIVGPSPKSTSEKPTAADAGPRVGSGTTTPSMVIVTVDGPEVGSRSTRWPSADSDCSSRVTCWGARSSTAIVTAPRWRTAPAPCGWCSVTWSMGSATRNRMR